MPIVFGESAYSVEEIVDVFERFGDRVRGTYRAHYRFDRGTRDPYTAPRLERPESLRDNPPDVIYPWEQIFLGVKKEYLWREWQRALELDAETRGGASVPVAETPGGEAQKSLQYASWG